MPDYRNELIIDQQTFSREAILTRLETLKFNSLSKVELFLWDLEIFLQIQKRLGDRIILKGGAATQFYIPLWFQRTSIDIDMICLSSRQEIQDAIIDIENKLCYGDEYFRFAPYKPATPKIELNKLDTYYITVPSICSNNELRGLKRLEIILEDIFYNNYSLFRFDDIENLIDITEFSEVRGPERGTKINAIRDALKHNYYTFVTNPDQLFRNRLDRIIWELAISVQIDDLRSIIHQAI